MQLNVKTALLELRPSANYVAASMSTSSRYVSYVPPSTVISDSLDQIMKNHTLVCAELDSVEWALSDPKPQT